MAYVDPNYATKKELKQAVADGKQLRPYNPSGLFETPQNGTVVIEGPHYPKPHKWYANATVKDGIITRIS